MSSRCDLKEGQRETRGGARMKEEEREKTTPRPHTPTASQDVTKIKMGSWLGVRDSTMFDEC